MESILQICTAAIGTLGFAVLYNVRGKKLLLLTIGGALGWAVYLLCAAADLTLFVRTLLATMSVAAAAEILARTLHAPVLVSLVPMIIPLVPGKDLYYLMSALVRGEPVQFARSAQQALTAAGAIALGVISVAAIVHLIMGVWEHAVRNRNPKSHS